MPRLLSVCMVALWVVGASGAPEKGKDEAAGKEMKKLEGTWKVISMIAEGKVVEGKEANITHVVIEGDQMILKQNDKEIARFSIKIDPGQNPKTMDWVSGKKGTLPTIYGLEDDKLQLCFPLLRTDRKVAVERPRSFETKDKPIGLLKLERAKK